MQCQKKEIVKNRLIVRDKMVSNLTSKVDKKLESKLNALELLIKIGRVADQEGNFILEGRYSETTSPNYLMNGRAILVELEMFKDYPNYTNRLIFSGEFSIYTYKLEGNLSKKGILVYENVVSEFKDSI